MIASLRRRFEQNQEDCTYTVLALLPTVRDEIIGSLPVEQITEQLQQERQERLKKLGGASDAASSEFPSAPASVTDDDGRSLASLQSGSYIHTSQMASSSLGGAEGSQPRPKRSKAQLWQDMKINSITRALTLLYTLSLLTLLTRIQLNLLGRRTYLSSVVALASPPAAASSSKISLENNDDDNYDNVYGNDFETNRKYLTFSWWLLHRGCQQIKDRVSAAVKDVFGQVNIREDLTLERLSELILQVRKKVEGTTEEERRDMKWLSFLLPSREDEAFVMRQSGMSPSETSPLPAEDPLQNASVSSASPPETQDAGTSPSLRRLLDETSDLIDSPTFTHVLTLLLDTAFSHLVDYRIATEAFKATGAAAPGTALEDLPRVQEVNENRCKLAHILPVFCRQAHAIAAGSGELDALAGVASQTGLGNEYLGAIDQVHDLEAFAAVIYSSNFEYEAAEAEIAPATNIVTAEEPAVVDAELQAETETLQEMDPQAVVDQTLGESEVTAPEAVADDSGPIVEEEVETTGNMQSAWEKAIAREDGIKPGEELEQK